MDKNALLQFRNKLFHGGVAYTHVKRSLRELKDHAQDIQQQALLDGYSKDKAKELALEQIGNLDNLAEDIISRPELKSFGYRYPKFSMLFGPLLMYLITVVMMGVLLATGAITVKWILGDFNLLPYSYWLNRSLEFFRFGLMYLVPLILSILFATYALKNRLAKRYFTWGVVLLCIVSCAITFTFHVSWPDPIADMEGSIGINIGTYGLTDWGREFLYWNSFRLLVVLGFSFGYIYLFQKKLEHEII